MYVPNFANTFQSAKKIFFQFILCIISQHFCTTVQTLTLTLWRPLLPYGYSYKASCARPGLAVIRNFWHPGTLMLRGERQSAWMSKITNDQLNPVWHRMLYSCTHMATVRVNRLKVHYSIKKRYWQVDISAMFKQQLSNILVTFDACSKQGSSTEFIHLIDTNTCNNRPQPEFTHRYTYIHTLLSQEEINWCKLQMSAAILRIFTVQSYKSASRSNYAVDICIRLSYQQDH